MRKNIRDRQLTRICSDALRLYSFTKSLIMKSLLNQKSFLLSLLLLAVIMLAACADNEVIDQCLSGHEYGFFGGLWHGFIAPFDFIGMLFNDEIAMYAPNNNGGLYALGFLLGSGGWGFFGGRTVKSIRHTRVNYNSQQFDKSEIVE